MLERLVSRNLELAQNVRGPMPIESLRDVPLRMSVRQCMRGHIISTYALSCRAT